MHYYNQYVVYQTIILTIQESSVGHYVYIRVDQFDVNKSSYHFYQSVRLNYVWSSFGRYNLQSTKLDFTITTTPGRTDPNSSDPVEILRGVASLFKPRGD